MKQHYLPTPEQIQEECQKIRNSWDDAERQTRKVGVPRQRGFGLRVINTSFLSPVAVQSIDDSLEGWHYLDDSELARDQRRIARRRAATTSLPEDPPEEELIDDSTVEAVVVEFGD